MTATMCTMCGRFVILSADLPSLDDLTPYEITIWSSPEDSPGLIGAGETISDYLGTGGNLLLTGQDVGFWDGGLNGLSWHPYYGRFLKAEAVIDDAGRSDVVGRPGDILDGLSLSINGPDSAGNQVAPDGIDLFDTRGAAIIADYAAGIGAAVRAEGCQSYQVGLSSRRPGGTGRPRPTNRGNGTGTELVGHARFQRYRPICCPLARTRSG